MKQHMHNSAHYIRLILMLTLSFAAMYCLMYAMVDVFANAIPNYNQFYMAGLMTAPMAIFELIFMGSMYPRKKLNLTIGTLSILFMLFCWIGIRQQVGIGDTQFLTSMIPHHAAALLMCERAHLSDEEIRNLCQNIISGQQREIDQMKRILEREK